MGLLFLYVGGPGAKYDNETTRDAHLLKFVNVEVTVNVDFNRLLPYHDLVWIIKQIYDAKIKMRSDRRDGWNGYIGDPMGASIRPVQLPP